MCYTIDLNNFREGSLGWEIPIIEKKSKKLSKEKIERNDCISDTFSIEYEDMCIWFSSRVQQDIIEDREEVELFFRKYFTGEDVYAIIGFMRKMLEK